MLREANLNVAAHYRELLASHYTWMLGGDIERVAAQDRQLFDELGLSAPSGHGVAVNLGCGELVHLAYSRSAVRTHCGDLLDALPEVAAPGSVDAIVCLRDTLLHLPDLDAVDLLLTRARSSLATGGTLVLTYRDLTQQLAGIDRFLPVCSDDDRIMLCALDYDSPEVVTVNDLVYTRTSDGWQLYKSNYPKLRIAPDALVTRIEAAGLAVTHQHHMLESNGMWATVACPPQQDTATLR